VAKVSLQLEQTKKVASGVAHLQSPTFASKHCTHKFPKTLTFDSQITHKPLTNHSQTTHKSLTNPTHNHK